MWWYNNFQNCARPPSWISKFWKSSCSTVITGQYSRILHCRSKFRENLLLLPLQTLQCMGLVDTGWGQSRLSENIFSSLQDHALFQVFYGFACLKNLSVDPLARFDRIFLAGIRHFDFDECTLTASCKPATIHTKYYYMVPAYAG